MALAGILPNFSPDDVDRPHPVAAMVTARRGSRETLTEAEERGYQRGLAAAREEERLRSADAETEWERRLNDARARWLAEEAGRLADGWKAALEDLETRLADTAAGLLAPLVEAALAAKAASELSAAVADLLSQDARKIIRVTGPADLVEMLRVRLGEAAGSIEFTTAGSVDLKLVAGDTVFETQLEPWSQRLRHAIDGGPHG